MKKSWLFMFQQPRSGEDKDVRRFKITEHVLPHIQAKPDGPHGLQGIHRNE